MRRADGGAGALPAAAHGRGLGGRVSLYLGRDPAAECGPARPRAVAASARRRKGGRAGGAPSRFGRRQRPKGHGVRGGGAEPPRGLGRRDQANTGRRRSPVTVGNSADSDRAARKSSPPIGRGAKARAGAAIGQSGGRLSDRTGAGRDKCTTRATRAASSMTGDTWGPRLPQHWKGTLLMCTHHDQPRRLRPRTPWTARTALRARHRGAQRCNK